jgi:hypothetical protein
MPKLTKKARLEWSLFLNEYGRRQYNAFCLKCRHECKQPYRVTVLCCPKHEGKQKPMI